VFHAAPARFLGRSGRVAAVEFQRMRPGAPDKSGRRRPEPIPGATFVLDAALVLTAIGEELERESLEDAFAVRDGRLLADAWGRTSHQAVFAGGDAATGAGTVVDAIGSGRRAATAIAALFEGRDPVAEAGATRLESSVLNLFYFARSAQARQPLATRDLPPRSFAEVVGGLTWREAAAEAARCLSCGSCTGCDNCYVFCPDAAILRDATTGGYSIDFNHCKGCGICAAECPRGALVLVAEDLR
jgi:2-oxoacid:acceptor oxidoreductase delta subunit (pyruvate/2-ketoisovalerate family)